MNKTLFLLFAAALGALMTSCVKDDLYETPHPTTGALVVTTGWDARSSNATIPDEYVIRVGEQMQEVSGLTNTCNSLLSPGQHTMLVYNRPAGIDISGDIATVASDSRAADRIHPLPGFLFGYSTEFTVAADDTLRVTAPMIQYVRTLRIELNISDGDVSRVTGSTGQLEGVESAINLLSGQRLAKSATVINDYEVSADKMVITYHLLGMVPDATKSLTTHIVFSNGDTQTITSDITGQLTDFHGDIEPLTLSASLSLPKQPGFSATIENWHTVDGGNVDAH